MAGKYPRVAERRRKVGDLSSRRYVLDRPERTLVTEPVRDRITRGTHTSSPWRDRSVGVLWRAQNHRGSFAGDQGTCLRSPGGSPEASSSAFHSGVENPRPRHQQETV